MARRGDGATDRPKQRVNKLSAAQRQLRTAVSMFFDYGDDVSIHTLVAAARQLLHDLLKKRGLRPVVVEHSEEMYTPEGQKLFRTAIVEAENFFKHAHRDPDRELEFSSEATIFMLVECAEDYRRLTGRSLRELWVFVLWFSLEYPEALLPGKLLDAVTEVRGQGGPPPHHDRRLFFKALNSPRLYPNLD